MKKLVLLAASAALLSSPAFSADAVVYEPAPAAVAAPAAFNWSGAYIGAHLGYGWGMTEDGNNNRAPKKDMDGWLGGLQAGYNWQFDNNVVFGAEADVSLGAVKNKWVESIDGIEAQSPNSTYYTEDKIGTHGTLRARLGYAVDRFMPYVTGGLGWANLEHVIGCTDKDITSIPVGSTSCRDSNTNGRTSFENSASKTVLGYSLGAGAEYAVANNWTLKAEYLFSDYGKHNVAIFDPNWPAATDRKFDTSLHTVSVGVNYRF